MPLVERTAADALGLIRNWKMSPRFWTRAIAFPAEDTHLLHVIRMALRDQLRSFGNFLPVPLPEWSDLDERPLRCLPWTADG